jgi:hypothetical protein
MVACEIDAAAMKTNRWGFSFVAMATAVAALGCAADAGLDKAEDQSSPEEIRLGGFTQDLGTIAYGAMRTVRYANPPGLRSLRFRAAAGDRADVWVRSSTGDAMVWLTDASRNIVAANDDAPGAGLDARINVTLRTAGEYTIFFRDYHRQSHTFTVSLAGGPDFFSCRTHRDCVSVSRGGCCSSWQRIAVNSARASAYAAANVCRPPYPPCAQPIDELVAQQAALVPVCNPERNQCELIAPEEIRCGGRSATAPSCPAGYVCAGPELLYDGQGRCVRGCTTRDGSVIAPGQSVDDACNTCVCVDGGLLRCTQRACPAPTCTHMGRSYPVGAFNDGCNDCNCRDDGTVVCTRRACICNPANEPNRRYVGTPETCPLIRFACMTGERMFSNACGCGCER